MEVCVIPPSYDDTATTSESPYQLYLEIKVGEKNNLTIGEENHS